MIISDLNPTGSAVPDASEPSVTRGANFIFESMRVGPEETAHHFISQSYPDRKRDLTDITEFMRFTREWFVALDQCHLGMHDLPVDTPQHKE